MMKRSMVFYGTKKNGPTDPEKEKPTKPMSKVEFKKAKEEAKQVKKAVKQQAKLEKLKSPTTIGEKFEKAGNVAGTVGSIVGTVSGVGALFNKKKRSSSYE